MNPWLRLVVTLHRRKAGIPGTPCLQWRRDDVSPGQRELVVHFGLVYLYLTVLPNG